MTLQRAHIDGVPHPLWLRPRTTDELCLRQVFECGEYDFKFDVAPAVIVDAGANVGCASVFFATRFPAAKIFAIEPESSNYSLLQRNVLPYPNIVPIHAALWPSDEEIGVTDPQIGAWGFRTETKSDDDSTIESVQAITIDRLMIEYDLPAIDLLKVDIEGAEKSLFESAATWIHHVQAITIELHDRYVPGCQAAFLAAVKDGFPQRWVQGENVCVARKELSISVPSRQPSLDRSTYLPCKIVATMLCRNNESIVAEAIRSVIDWVDAFILIDTGIRDNSLSIAEEIAGEKLTVRTFEWSNDYGAARNFALEAAREAEGDWALTIDTDERLLASGYDDIQSLRAALSSDPATRAWFVPARDGSYDKERFIRLPTPLQWVGRVHESLMGAATNERKRLPGWLFFEVPKTRDQFQEKLQRELTMLREETANSSREPRWWYYLGQTQEDLKQYSEAIESYQRCYEIRDGWPEQAAWACFKMARCRFELHQFDLAIEACTKGLARQPGSPELAWLAAVCCYKLGRDIDAITWAEVAVRLGHFNGLNAGKERITFRHVVGWYEGPYDVLRLAHQRRGDHARAADAATKFEEAKAARLSVNDPTESRTETTEEVSSVRKRVVVIGTYSSGSSATAGLLHHLGVVMGKEFVRDTFEARWMAEQLRRWWDEPALRETVPSSARVRTLQQWVREMERENDSTVGVKHPLLSLCGSDVVDAWGASTKFIRCHRPLPESIESLQRRAWWPDQEAGIQRRLYEAADTFFDQRPHLTIEFSELVSNPQKQVDRIIEYLELKPTTQQYDAAVASIVRKP